MRAPPARRRGSLVAPALALLAGGLASGAAAAPHPPRADLVLLGARIYTGAAGGPASALAARDGRLVYVGDEAGARPYIGLRTHVEHGAGRRVLPGLVDAHLHPLDIVELGECDLDSEPLSLRQLAARVRACVARRAPRSGRWLHVHGWNFAAGNQPDADYPTLRVALDRAAAGGPVQLYGNDFHHAAFNSAALALARNRAGRVVGLDRAQLAGAFAPYARLVAVDGAGEPSGAVNEDARYLLNPHAMLYADLEALARAPQRVPQRLNAAGVTAALDAMALPDGLPFYDALLRRGQLTARITLAQFYDPERVRGADGRIDWEAMLAAAGRVRARYAGNPLLRADVVKLFADGVLEGNPLAVPVALPGASALEPYLQPLFALDGDGRPAVRGYADTTGALCAAARAAGGRYESPAEVQAFQAANGFHPAQCAISSGQLQHRREVILEFARRFHQAGFSLHVHAIGDGGVRTAIDAIEAARAGDGVRTTRDAIAHLQLVHPDDVARMGRDRLYAVYTFAWANVEPQYDTTVVPFIQHVAGPDPAALHVAGSYYEQNAYPVRSSRDAGAIVVAGSDAPVETRDPRPFVNLSMAVTRRLPGAPPLNERQAIPFRDALQAYTLNGARLLGRDDEIGSLEVGKSADFILVDRDVLALADAGRAEEIAATRVLATWFRGRRVFVAVRR